MRIAIFTDTYSPEINGVATSCESLFNLLKKEGHEVYLFTTGKKTEYNPDTHIYRIHGLFLKQLYGYRLASPIRFKVFSFIKNLHLNVIHINTEYGIGLIGIHASKKFNIPIAYTYHTNLEDYTYYITKGIMDNQAKKVLRVILTKYCNHVNELITPSADTKERLEKMGIKKYINVVPTGFDFKRFNDFDKNCEKCLKIKKSLQISDENKIFLCLGRLAKEKSFDFVIASFKYYLSKTKDSKARLIIVGDGPYHKNLTKLVEKYELSNYVMFVGKVPQSEVTYYYKIADVYINASLTETQGLTYMEAMAAKTIILTRKSPILENVIVDGKDGFYFENEKEFTEKISYISSLNENQKEEIRNNALKIIDEYSLENFYKNIIRVYKRAIRDRW